jgi:CheY-like chemotaxis protein
VVAAAAAWDATMRVAPGVCNTVNTEGRSDLLSTETRVVLRRPMRRSRRDGISVQSCRFTYNREKRMTTNAARQVLVVEDDVSVRRPLVRFLEMHGFTVVTAETADEGRAAMKTHPLAAAVVDLRLKRGSGRDVVGAAPEDVPVIIFSGVPSESAELERLRPRTRLIEKPYSLVLLVETLEEMLAESQKTHP